MSDFRGTVERGQQRTLERVDFGGDGRVVGFRGLAHGAL